MSTTRLSEIAASLERGDALSGALSALDGWEARNIGAARMRAHVSDAAAQLAEAAAELRATEAEMLEEHVLMAIQLERQPMRLSWWQRIFGAHE